MACPTAGFSHGVVAAPALLPGEEGEVTRLEGRIGVLTGALGMGEAGKRSGHCPGIAA